MHARRQAAGRPATLACEAMVSSPHPLATAAGVQALAGGGNAIDAAVAASAVLTVVYPHMAGIGGDLFALVWSASPPALIGLNASGPSAAAADIDWYARRGCSVIPERGPRAALTVPGTVGGWAALLERFGRRGLDAALAPAIHHARAGFPVSRGLAQWLRRDRRILAADPATRSALLPGGRPPDLGTRLALPALAATLEAIALGGADVFYRGELANRIGRALEDAGSPLRAGDFGAYAPRWVEPVRSDYRGHAVCTLPPNSQGMALLQILNLVEGFDLTSSGDLSADYVHLLAAATRIAYEDRDRHAVDPDFAPAPLDDLLSKERSSERRPELALPPAGLPPGPAAGGDTVYLCTADAAGNRVSLIQSLFHDFGSACTAGETGVLMQNRGCAFPLDPTHPGRLQPRKRPFHTLMPAMVLGDDGTPELVAGAMGGEGQPQTVAALVTRVLDFGCDVQQAIEAPRWVLGRTWGAPSAALAIEASFPRSTLGGLRARGYEIRRTAAGNDLFGHAQAIRVDRRNGVLWGAADPRGDGVALGL